MVTPGDLEPIDTSALHRVVGGGIADDLAAHCGNKKAAALASGTRALLKKLGPQQRDHLYGYSSYGPVSSDFNLLSSGVEGIRNAANAAEADCLAKGNALIQNPASGLSTLIDQL